MTVYLIILINVHDREEYDIYVKGFLGVLSKSEGKILAVSEAPTVIEGPWPYARNIIMQFPSEDAVNLWYKSPAYQELVQHRWKAATSIIAMIPELVMPGQKPA